MIEPVEPLTAEIEYFVSCIATGRTPTRSSGADGLAVLRVLEAADRSALTGTSEAVDGATPASALTQ